MATADLSALDLIASVLNARDVVTEVPPGWVTVEQWAQRRNVSPSIASNELRLGAKDGRLERMEIKPKGHRAFFAYRVKPEEKPKRRK